MHQANIILMLTHCKLFIDIAIVINRYNAKINDILNYYLQVTFTLFNLRITKSSDYLFNLPLIYAFIL